MSTLSRHARRGTIAALIAATAVVAVPAAAMAAPAPAAPPAAATARTEAFGQGCFEVLTLLFGPGGEIWKIAATDPAAVPSTLYAWLVANPAAPTVTQLCLSGA